jgi:predicted nucleotidyltransferase
MRRRHDISRIGCFGSLAAGNWGVGSDIDIIIELIESSTVPLLRAMEWDTTSLLVPADVVVLTKEEAARLSSARFRNVLEKETVWVETANPGT